MKRNHWVMSALGVLFFTLSPMAQAVAEPEDPAGDTSDRDDAHEDHESEERESEEHDESSENHDDEDHDRGSSESLRDLTDDEHPDYDDDRFPVVRDEVIGLDLSESGLTAATTRGFRVIDTMRLSTLHSSVTRLSVPPGMRLGEAAALLRQVDPHATVALSHYYGPPASGRQNARRTRITPNTQPPQRIIPRLRIGMIDSGVDQHPMLDRTAITRAQFGNAAEDPSGHGTAVASVLASDGATEILAANVFRGGGGRQFTTPDAIIRGLGWLINHRVPVINISLAGPRNAVLDALFARALANGHVIVAAAGNGGPSAPPAYPAALDGVVAVTAVDAQHHIYRYANRGDYVRVSAIGVAVPTAAPGGMQAMQSGTSFAAPHIAARLARCATRITTSNSHCITAMERTAIDLGVPGRDPIYGLGLIR